MNKIILFQRKQKKDTIDVWWLSDDGGKPMDAFLVYFAFINFYSSRFDFAATRNNQHSIQLGRDQITNFLLGVWCSWIRKRTKRVYTSTANIDYKFTLLKPRMAVLLSKFRIDYSDLVIISDIDEPPKKKTKQWFHGVVHKFLESKTNGS